MSASGGQKTIILGNFRYLGLGDSCTDPLLPMRAKFGVLEQIQGLHLQAKFHFSLGLTVEALQGKTCQEGVGHLEPRFQGEGVVPGECFWFLQN